MIFSRHVGAFVSKQKKNYIFLQKDLAKASEMPIIRPTQRRAVVKLYKNQCVVVFCSLTMY
ncbi:hypothetical protein, partial [Haemophilus parainfluenzae]|uniref:hypothetical protein n=1 Tax=Haemophilus parainfluenzae TaxID=729 RepID=UPI00223F3687